MENNQRTIVIALAAIAVLLAAIVGLMLFKQTQGVPAPTVQNPGSEIQQQQANGAPTQPSAPVDPSKATKLPAGTAPEKWVEQYYTACEKKDYATAVKRLPADAQANTTPDALKSQLESYNVTGWKITGNEKQGDSVVISAEQITGFGTFTTNWEFQKSGDTFVLVKKAVGGMK